MFDPISVLATSIHAASATRGTVRSLVTAATGVLRTSIFGIGCVSVEQIETLREVRCRRDRRIVVQVVRLVDGRTAET
jgi:hypothetical protein